MESAFERRVTPAFRIILALLSKRSLVGALDLIVAFNALALLVILLTGGVDLAVVSATRAEKPILILLVTIPLRLTLGRTTWKADELVWRSLTALRTRVLQLPTAVIDVSLALLFTRPINFLTGFVANLSFTPYRERAFAMPFESQKFAEIFADWDSGWYFDIASRGYYFRADGQSSVAFFPLYPMLMRAVGWTFGGTEKAIWLAGILVSWGAFAAALIVLHRFAERVFADREVARRTVLYVAVFPFSLFFTRVYAESVFLLMSVLAVSRAYDDRWWRAGVWGALATLARPNGILIALPLAIMALRTRPSPKEIAHRALALAAIPLALAGYCGFVYALSGDPLGWLNAQVNWGYSLGHPPWQLLLSLIGRIVKYGFYDYFFLSSKATYYLFHGVAGLIFLALTPIIFKRLGIALGSYVLVSLLVPLSGNALEGIGRYASVLFPAFMVLATFKMPRLHEGILIGGSLAHALLVALFSTGHPIY